MTATVTASEAQKNFGAWHDRSQKEPVRITKHGRETAYLVSAETFHELWACYRRAVGTTDLTDDEMALLRAADVPEEHAYEIADLSVPDTGSGPTGR